MRALCGAIITAGALIGLGLAALGYGLRYSGTAFGPGVINPDTNALWGAPTLTLILVVLLLAMLVGMGIAFLGLAYHHYRRYQEDQQLTGVMAESE